MKAADFYKVEQNLKAARQVRDEGGYACGLYASSIRYDDAQLVRMEAAVQRILPYVDEHYWLPLYGQAGLTSGARGTRPSAGNQGRVGALRKLTVETFMEAWHSAAFQRLRRANLAEDVRGTVCEKCIAYD